MKKIEAFTILEMIISMVISGILVSFTLWIYLNMQKNYLKVTRDNKENNEIMTLSTLLKKDTGDAVHIFHEYGYLEFEYKVHNVQYLFEDGYILRWEGMRNDTFKLKPVNLEVEYLDKKERKVSVLSFDIVLGKNLVFPIRLKKEYGNRVLLEEELEK